MNTSSANRRWADYILRALADVVNCSEEELLNRAGIPPPRWRDPSRVPQTLFPRIWRVAETLTGRKQIGLDVAKRIQVADLGSVGFEMLSAENPRQALEGFARHGGIVDDVLNYSVKQQGSYLMAIAKPVTSDATITHHAIDIAVAASASVLQGQLSGGLLKVHEAHFTHDGFGCQDEYESVLGCPCRFNQQCAALVFYLPELPERMPAADAEINDTLRSQLDEQSSNSRPWSQAIMSLIEKRLEQRLPVSRKHIAAQFNMSERSLLRRLSSEEEKFQELSDRSMVILARRYLARGWSTAKIAEALNYSDAAALGKMLKRKTGMGIFALRKEG